MKKIQILTGLFLLLVLALFCLGYAYFVEPQRLVVRHHTLTIKGWDPAFDGLKIAMLGDIHGGSNGSDGSKLRDVVIRTNAEAPDIVVLLGDYVSESPSDEPRMPVPTIFQALAGFRASGGVYAVLGNHDKWSQADLKEAIERQGYELLIDRTAVVVRNGKPLRMLGLRDHLSLPSNWAAVADEARSALSGTPEGDLIVLQHSPDILPVITGEQLISPGLKLFLAAHTHGGQVWLPILGRPIIPSSYGQKYAYGHVRQNEVDLFVTSGIGTSVLPFRFLVPPEIVILTIKAG